MAQDFARTFYRSKEWKRCRSSYIAKRINIDGGMCEVCHERLGYIVHHTITLTPVNIKDPEVSLNHDYMSYECKQCHDRHEGHGIYNGALPVCGFDANGNVIGILPPFERDRV